MPQYYAESDGGGFWAGHYWSEQPKTFYVVNSEAQERIECESMSRAEELARRLMADEVRWADVNS